MTINKKEAMNILINNGCFKYNIKSDKIFIYGSTGEYLGVLRYNTYLTLVKEQNIIFDSEKKAYKYQINDKNNLVKETFDRMRKTTMTELKKISSKDLRIICRILN